MIIQSDYTYRCVLTEPSRGEDRGVLVSDDAFPSRFFLFAPRASFVLFRADPDVARLLARYRRLDWNGTPSPERSRIGLTRLWAARRPSLECSASSGKRALRRTGENTVKEGWQARQEGSRREGRKDAKIEREEVQAMMMAPNPNASGVYRR